MPGIEGATDRYTSVDHQLVPSVPAYVQYGWNKGRSHIRLSGIYRNIAYTDLANDKSNSQTGWGVQATSVVAIGKPFQIYLQYAYGKGIGSLINDISNLSVDIVPDVDNVGKMQLLPMSGWYAGVQYNFTPKIFSDNISLPIFSGMLFPIYSWEWNICMVGGRISIKTEIRQTG